jgi:outer membrane protein assembly factor BamB
MGRSSKSVALILILIMATSSLNLMMIKPASAQTSSDDWTMFHYDPAHTGYTPSQALTTPPVVIWSSPPEEIGSHASPAIANGVVYITSSGLHAYNAFTGAELWSPNPAGAFVNQAFSGGYLYALAYSADFPQLGSHVDALLCLDAISGAQVWRVPISFITSDPAVANGMLYIAGSDNKLHVFNATTGAQLWSYPVKYVQVNAPGASPTIYGGIVYTVSEDDNVYALNASDETKIWNYTTGFFVESCPAVANGIVYVSSDDGNLYALNAENGAKIWNYTTSGGASSPAVADNVVYVGGADGNLYALDASNGNKLWNFTLQPSGQVYNGLLCSPAVVDGRVYIGSNTHVMTVLGASNSTTSTSPSPFIPEFPTWIILPLFTVMILLSIVFVRKRIPKNR